MKTFLTNRLRTSFIGFMCLLFVLAPGGCKSQPAIAGEPPVEWKLTTMQSKAVTAPRPVILRLANDGSMSGQSFVNNYFGEATISTGGKIDIGQVGSTMMAASEELMDSEHTYFHLLEQANGYTTSGDTLTLLLDDQPLLVFIRQAS